jgi:HD-GYP domain-containing protein (c-di-GMP phosphodiesterase class II)
MSSSLDIFDFIQCFSDALDLIVPDLNGHHKRVAYIARSIAAAMDLPEAEQYDILLAGMLHDAGALTLKSRIEAMDFETRETNHSETGYRLLRKWAALHNAAHAIRFHHTQYDDGREIPESALILHLADRLDVLIRRDVFILDQVPILRAEILRRKGTMFDPRHVDALMSLIDKEFFWLDIASDSLRETLKRLDGEIAADKTAPDIRAIADFSRIFAHIIDFRSRFTATHSAGVAHVAEALAEIAGLPKAKRQRLRIAGYLHDLGKLAVPVELLEKNAPLTLEEFNLVKSHAYHTHRILLGLPGLDDIRTWASTHHEFLSGEGYPFHFKSDQLSLGSRLMTVADIFTAIAEDRPYRLGMLRDQAVFVMRELASEGKIDAEVLTMLFDNFEHIDQARRQAQEAARLEYAELAFRP